MGRVLMTSASLYDSETHSLRRNFVGKNSKSGIRLLCSGGSTSFALFAHSLRPTASLRRPRDRFGRRTQWRSKL